jgi:hypothetical protein
LIAVVTLLLEFFDFGNDASSQCAPAAARVLQTHSKRLWGLVDGAWLAWGSRAGWGPKRDGFLACVVVVSSAGVVLEERLAFARVPAAERNAMAKCALHIIHKA